MASDTDRSGSFAMNDDNRYVAVLNSNSDRRIFDNNWFDNRWNADNRFLFVRKSLRSFLTILILWVGIVLIQDIFASFLYLVRFHSGECKAPRIFCDPNISPPTQFA